MYPESMYLFPSRSHLHCLPLIPIPCATSARREAAVLKQSGSSNYNYSCQHCAMACDAYFEGSKSIIIHLEGSGSMLKHAHLQKFENNHGLLK